MIVVDTNVVSELMRPVPSTAVLDWMEVNDGPDLYTTAVTVAEVRYGIERLARGRRRDQLDEIAGEIVSSFAHKILPFDVVAAQRYGVVVSHRDELGMSIDALDAQIVAICAAVRAPLATRNVADFRETGIEVVNPWHPST
jgi:predicted nucleic acid-binding protein